MWVDFLVEAFLWEWRLLILSGSSTHMNVEEVGAATRAGRHAPWVHPSPYKSPPSPPLISHLLVKDLSPPLEFPHGLGSARYIFPVAFSRRICCFRCFAGARARRLSGYLDVCAITDAPLLCSAGRDGAGPAGPD